MSQTLAAQREAVHDWLRSDGALAHATAVTHKRRLAGVDPESLINDAWIRVDRAFSKRSQPYPDLSSAEAVRRFTYRILDNLAIDKARSAARHADNLVPLTGDRHSATAETGFDDIDQHDLLIRLIERIPEVAERLPTCPGCAHAVVVALALDVCQSLLAGIDGDFDTLVYAGLRRVQGEPDDRSPATSAERQRKARCGRCTRLLLEAAFNVSGVA